MKKAIFLIILSAGFFCGWSQSFESGGLRFQALPDETGRCEVTWAEAALYTGSINVPEVVVSEGTEYKVTAIGPYAFAGCSELTDVTIPQSVTRIGRNAFQGCSSLKEVILPEEVTVLEDQTFYSCSSLQVIRGLGLTMLGRSAFSNCSRLTELQLTEAPLAIGESCFYNCSALKEAPIGVYTELEEGAFRGCSSLTEVKLPSDIKTLPDYIFSDCVALAKVEGGENLRIIGNSAFNACSSLENITFGKSLEEIGDYAFAFCENLKTETISGEGLTIGAYAFNGCESIETLTLSGVVKIGEEAFSYATGLKTLIFDATLHDIGDRAFRHDLAITKIICPAEIPPMTSNTAFESVLYDSANLEVASGKGLLYAQTSPWSYFRNITELPPSGLGLPSLSSNFTIECLGSTVTLNGNPGIVDVFNISGVKIFSLLKGNEPLRIELPGSGIYFINEKKIMIK